MKNRWSPGVAICAFILVSCSGHSFLDGVRPSSPENSQVIVAEQKRLTYHKSDVYSIAWSTDGEKIVYSLFDPQRGVANVWKMRSDGAGQERLTEVAHNDYDPSFSPDGSRIVFFSDRPGNNDVYVMNSDGSHVRQLTASPDDDVHPSWSPDGEKIAFISSRSGERAIWLMDPDGQNQKQITWGGNGDWSTTWSPDGRYVAFASTRITEENKEQLALGDEGYEVFDPMCSMPKLYSHIWSVNVQTGEVKKLTYGKIHDWRPVWGPDGEHIAFVSDRSGNCDVWIMDRSGENLQQLTHGPLYDGLPTWNPFKREIAFVSNREGNFDIWTLNFKVK